MTEIPMLIEIDNFSVGQTKRISHIKNLGSAEFSSAVVHRNIQQEGGQKKQTGKVFTKLHPRLFCSIATSEKFSLRTFKRKSFSKSPVSNQLVTREQLATQSEHHLTEKLAKFEF